MTSRYSLICHVTRNTCIDGVNTKRNKPVNPYGVFRVPRSLDGFAGTASDFVPAALICHRGPSHETGHYFVSLIYKDLMWLANDGQALVHLLRVTPKLSSQISQIWSVVRGDTFRTTQQPTTS